MGIASNIPRFQQSENRGYDERNSMGGPDAKSRTSSFTGSINHGKDLDGSMRVFEYPFP
jgi:hypothetical protein